MMRMSANNLDFLATRLHARRSRMAEAGRLDEFCRVVTLPELGRALLPGTDFSVPAEFQRQLVQNLIQEISDSLKHLEEESHDFIAWLLTRFQVENMKILLRGFLHHTPLETLQPHLATLPPGMAIDAARLMAAKSIEDFIPLLPGGRPRNRLHAVMADRREPPAAFVLEAALDCGYFHELLARAGRLRGGEDEIVKPLVFQEANLFQFLLVTRGKFHFGLPAEMFAPLRIARSGASGEWFNTLLSASDYSAAAKCAVGTVIDALPTGAADSSAVDISTVEALAWQRYLRLANSAFRRSHMGVGAVAGYFGVRRMEIANLITLSEGIRLSVGERELRARMIPRKEPETVHV